MAESIDSCSGGCAVNQKCDTMTRTCVTGCAPACTNGETCTKTPMGTFQCVPFTVACNGMACQAGEVACFNGACSCLTASAAAVDSCAGEGKFCVGAACQAPKRFQQCKLDGAPCGIGYVCNPVFGDDQAVCTKKCMADLECDLGEFCSDVGCLPSGLFRDQFCAVSTSITDDAGTRSVTRAVTVGSKCQQRAANGSFTETTPSGTCRLAFFSFYDQGDFPFDYCAPGGQALENAECKVGDTSRTGIAKQCAAGLECVNTKGNGDDGICLRTCNAQPQKPGFDPLPGCGTGESCVNIYRYLDPANNSTLGACMKTCNVFDTAKLNCANYGATPASCVPTTGTAGGLISFDGNSLCIPQQATVSAVGASCPEANAFKGAACASAQLCTAGNNTATPSCIQVCDTSCTGATPPARCATQPNATCTGGKSCKRVTTTTGATVGFCE
jgi:hypothetical protein